jgi:hypothetical protein
MIFRIKRRRKVNNKARPLELELKDLPTSRKIPQLADHLPTLRDINPARYDFEPAEDDAPRDSMPTLEDIDPLRYDQPC